MLPAQFKLAVEKALFDLIQTPEFIDAAERNWQNGQGNEEELYPFFYEVLRQNLGCTVKGLGYGKPKGSSEKVDCLCYFHETGIQVYGIEIKGPSKDQTWVSAGVNADLEKLNTLTQRGNLSYGIAVGIYLLEKTRCCANMLTINSEEVCIKIEAKETQRVEM
jgi:hypothetical protein